MTIGDDGDDEYGYGDGVKIIVIIVTVRRQSQATKVGSLFGKMDPPSRRNGSDCSDNGRYFSKKCPLF